MKRVWYVTLSFSLLLSHSFFVFLFNYSSSSSRPGKVSLVVPRGDWLDRLGLGDVAGDIGPPVLLAS
jgi:hypothetical protein